MNNEDRDQTAEENKSGERVGDAQELGLTQEDEAVLLKRLRDLGYVE